jgi:ankyrin repeat protein
LAAVTGNSEVILLLLKHGASLRVLDSQGRSPLHLAAWSGKAACVKLLLDNAMDMLNAKTTCGEDKKQMQQQAMDLWKSEQVFTSNEVSGQHSNKGF